ncbi:MAG: hypothetical protein IPM54_43460 [Polyangiaceae bacterium]|nr:hypothetical protein [Polyangiaceae bacterium]
MSLDGYEDGSVVFTVEPTEHPVVTLPFDKPPVSGVPCVTAASARAAEPPCQNFVSGDPNYSPKEDPFYVSPDVKKASGSSHRSSSS